MFDGKYLEWNQKRIKGIIDFYGYQFIANKKVLDLGCGHADISAAFYRLGADVTAVDGRQDNLTMVGKKYPGIKLVKADLDKNWPFGVKKYDIILNLGLLCHLNDFETHLRAVCASTSYLILETAVCDSDDPFKCEKGTENKNIYDLSINGVSCRPSVSAIERILKESGFTFKRIDSAKFNAGPYRYDWQAQNDHKSDFNKRRIWFARKLAANEPEIIKSPIILKNNSVPTINDSNIINKLSPSKNILSYNAIKPIDKNLQFPIKPNIRADSVRTAICLSGQLRTFEQTYESFLKYVLNKLDCDVFIHTWDELGNSSNLTNKKVSSLSAPSTQVKLNKLYSPKNIIIERERDFPINDLIRKSCQSYNVKGVLAMYYGIKSCINLKQQYENQNNFKYDCVIRARMDLNFHKPLEIIKSIDMSKIYLPKYGNYGGYCDQFAFSSSENMDLYAQLFDYIQKYLSEGCIFNPEVMLKYHINKNNLPVARSTVNYTILRNDGSVFDNFELEKSSGFLPKNAINLLKTLPDNVPAYSPLIDAE